ncbi:MAG: glycosyltransferase [Treponema sp.]|jgi:UDP:flavonoid glycosyltransferase YjiC (YdhE family)|nr:glycosyltransferase [Treponema sp.]
MNILLVNRGSQGDIYPYLALAQALQNRGHQVTYSAPRIFEKEVRETGIPYTLQAFDNIPGMLEGEPDTKNLLQWTARVIDSQFEELIPLLERHDILVAGNTEFAAPSIAEYCGKPLVRTSFGPFLPGNTVPPPVFPLVKPHPLIRPALLWFLLNRGLNLLVLKPLNRGRKTLGMPPIKDQGRHAPENADNFLLYSRYLGNTDPSWNQKYQWNIGGYCFNDSFPYDKQFQEELAAFCKKDRRPTLFFTLGSCNSVQRDQFARWLFNICRRHNYKLVVGCGWWKVGTHLHNEENLFLMHKAVPHVQVFPLVDAVIHHGGAGTTHSAARAGKPQMLVPLLLDQFYWGQRVKDLGIGPGSVKMRRLSEAKLEEKTLDLMNNGRYKIQAHALAEQIRSERGLEAACCHIEKYGAKNMGLAANQ